MPKKTPKSRRVRIQCDVPGHEDFWIEYDVSTWGIDFLTSIPYFPLYETVARVVPERSVDWHIVGDDGALVKHPGPGASQTLWRNIWKSVGPVTGQALWRWLGLSVFSAMGEAITPDFKSAEADCGAGERGDGTSPTGATVGVDDRETRGGDPGAEP